MSTQEKAIWGARPCIIAFALAVALLPGKGVWAQAPVHARLSQSLQQHVASKSKTGVDVIVHGTAEEMDALAARSGLTIRKRPEDGAVFRANGAQIDALSREFDV